MLTQSRLFNMGKKQNIKSGFTIVELLVVIVVIGILAAITTVSYSGISNKAIAASLQSDLGSNAKILKMYNVEYGYYPSSLDSNKCPLTPDASTSYCLKVLDGASLTYTGGGQTFKVKLTKNSISYQITESSVVTVQPVYESIEYPFPQVYNYTSWSMDWTTVINDKISEYLQTYKYVVVFCSSTNPNDSGKVYRVQASNTEPRVNFTTGYTYPYKLKTYPEIGTKYSPISATTYQTESNTLDGMVLWYEYADYISYSNVPIPKYIDDVKTGEAYYVNGSN